MKHWTPLIALALASSAFFACGSSDDKIGEDEAEDIAEKALLAITHLPGRGWEETARDNFDDDDTDFPDTDACEAMNEFFEDMEDGEEPLVETNVTYEQDTGDPIPFEVEAEVAVHEGTARELDLQEEAERLFENANFDDCMEDFAAQAGEEAGGEGQYRRREPSVDAPNDGFAMAFGIRLRVEGFEANVVGEFYIWHDEHVEASVAFIGTPEQVQEDFIEDVLEEAEDRVRAAQEE